MYFYNKKGHVKMKSTGSCSSSFIISLKAQIFIWTRQFPSTYFFRCKIVWKEEITSTQVSCFSLILGLRNVQFCVTFSVASTRVLKRIFTAIPFSSSKTSKGCQESYSKGHSKSRENHPTASTCRFLLKFPAQFSVK